LIGKTTSKLFTVSWLLHNSRMGKIDCYEDNPVWSIQVDNVIKKKIITMVKVDNSIVWTKKDGWLDSLFLIQMQDALAKVENVSTMDTCMVYAPYMPSMSS